MSVIKKELNKKNQDLPNDKIAPALDKQFNDIVEAAKEKYSQFMKPEEVEAVFANHKDFSKNIKATDLKNHTWFALIKQLYAQKRKIQWHYRIPNKSGQMKSGKDTANAWNYDVDFQIVKNKYETFNLADTFHSYQCPECSGNRKLVCSNCDCTGRVRNFTDDGWDTCGDCGGSGYVTCGKCEGYGSVYDIAELHVNHYVSEYVQMVTNEEYHQDEQRWIENGGDVVHKETVFGVKPLEGENFVIPDQFDGDENLLAFYEKSISWFKGNLEEGAKYLYEVDFFVNKFFTHSATMSYNGKTMEVALNEIAATGELVFDKYDLASFFDEEVQGLQKEFEKRRFKRNMMIGGLVASFIAAIIGYYSYTGAQEEKARQARYEQERIERQKKEEALQAKTAEHKAKFDKGYKEVMKLVRKKNFEKAHKILADLKANNITQFNQEQAAVWQSLSGLVNLKVTDLKPSIINDWNLKRVVQGKDYDFFQSCLAIPGCSNRNAPKIIRDAYYPKVKRLARKNHRTIASMRANDKLMRNAGESNSAVDSFKSEIQSYLKNNAYPTDKVQYDIAQPKITKKHNGSWQLSGTVTVDGEKMKFSTYMTKWKVINFKKIK
jgi:hypothetical protein